MTIRLGSFLIGLGAALAATLITNSLWLNSHTSPDKVPLMVFGVLAAIVTVGALIFEEAE